MVTLQKSSAQIVHVYGSGGKTANIIIIMREFKYKAPEKSSF